MEETFYFSALGFLGCVPHGKKAFCMPMHLLTPKMVRKLSDPNAVWLAKVDGVVEQSFTDTHARYMLRFGDHVFEAFSESRHELPEGRAVICFTPSVREYNGDEDTILTLHGSTYVTDKAIPDDYEGTDPSDVARDLQDLDFEIAKSIF
jgi:hypothetical protein